MNHPSLARFNNGRALRPVALWVGLVLALGLVLLILQQQQRTQAVAALQLQWRAGMRYSYNVSYNMQGTAHTDGTDVPLQEQLTASIVLHVLDVQPDAIHLLYEAQTVEPAAGLPHEWTVHLDDAGNTVQLRVPQRATRAQHDTVLALMHLLQLRWPAPPRAVWQASERDTNGGYTASYRLGEVDGPLLQIVKTVRDVKPQQAATKVVVDRHGSAQVLFDSGLGQVRRHTVDMQQTVHLGGAVVGEAHSQVTVQLCAAEHTSDEAQRAKQALAHQLERDATLASSEARPASGAPQQAAARLPSPDLSAATIMRAVLDPSLHAAERLPAYLQLTSLLQQRPEAAAAWVPILAHADPGSDTFDDVATALTRVGNAACQAALRATMLQRQTEPAALRALLPHLAHVEQPTLQSADFIEALLAQATDADTRAAAYLAYGSIGHGLLPQQPERADAILQEVTTALGAAQGPHQMPLLLATLGNLGHPEQTAVLLPFLHSANDIWREHAADALRFVPTDAAVDQLTQVAAADPSVVVRRAAMGALGYQPSSKNLHQFYAERVNAETDSTVLKQTLHNLANMTDEFAEAQQTLQNYAARCQSTDLCNYVRSLSQTI